LVCLGGEGGGGEGGEGGVGVDLLLHAHGPRTVVVTSPTLKEGDNDLHVVGSHSTY